jgi:hypothetical protein
MANLAKEQWNPKGTLIFIVIVSIILSLAGVTEAIKINKYIDDQAKISFDYPDVINWTIHKASELRQPGIVGFTNSKNKATIVVGFIQLPSVIPDLSEPGILHAAVDDIFGSYQKKNLKAKLISSKMLMNTQKIKGVEIVYTDVILGEVWKGRLVSFFKGTKRYDVTALAIKNQFQQADTEFFSLVLETFVMGVSETKKDNSSKLQESKPYSSSDILKPQEIKISQNTAENGEVLFEQDDPKVLKFSVSNTPYTTAVFNGKGCIFCTRTIILGPHAKVPTAVFEDSAFANNLKGASSYTIQNSFSGTIQIGAKKREYIIAGKNGAILKKEGNGFKLIQGNAYLKILDKFTE